MINFAKLSIFILIFTIVASCAEKNIKDDMAVDKVSADSLYRSAMQEIDNKNYEEAKKIFISIENSYPLSNEAVQSQTMLAFIEYLQMNYQEAIFKFDRVIKRYPSHKNIDYAYYMKAMCYYEQIDNAFLDGFNNLQALESFNQVINRFPNSKYSKDSEQKIIFVKENVAAKHMDIALFYLKNKKFLAAMNRYKKVIDKHPKSKFVPEALYRLVEIYYSLGMIDDAKKTASVLGYNYPKSIWYEYSYEIVGEKIDEKSDDRSFFSKISNLLNKEDE